MQNANEFAQTAQQINQLADRITPRDRDLYEQSRRLAVYHLRRAAMEVRAIAEALAKTEPPNAAA